MIVLWRTTTRCNYACSFCAYDRRLRIARQDVLAQAALRFGGLLADWSLARSERLLLSWLGGEPLLWRPVRAVSAALAARGLAISATTNGSTLHDRTLRAAVIASFSELTVSVDGPPHLHDRLRGRVGAFSQVRDGVRALAQDRDRDRLKLRANVVLMRDTVGHFADLCGELADWGIDEITFNQLGGRDRPEFFPSQRLLPSDIAELVAVVPDVRARLAERGVTLCGDPRYLDRLRASASDEAIRVDDCRPGERFLFVDENGIVSPCSFSGAAYGVPIDTIRTVGDLDALPVRFAAARATRRLATCDDCPSTQTFAKFAA